jgi:hypothetical protein
MAALIQGESHVAYVSVPDGDDDFERESNKMTNNGASHVKSVNEDSATVEVQTSGEEKEVSTRESRRQICFSMMSLLMSIPALIGG